MSLNVIDHIPDQEWARLRCLVGARLKKYRKVKGLTQAELGFLLGNQGPRQVGRWEAGKALPSVQSLIKLSFLLNRQLIDLLLPIHRYYFKMLQLELNAHDQNTCQEHEVG